MAREPRLTVRKAAPKPVEGPGAAETAQAATKAATASDEALAEALRETIVWDGGEPGKGRKIVLRKPGVIAQYRLVDAMGEKASNQTLMQMVNPLMFVSQIGEDPVFFPSTWDEIEALIERLGERGLAHVMIWYAEHVINPINDAVANAQAKARLKNG